MPVAESALQVAVDLVLGVVERMNHPHSEFIGRGAARLDVGDGWSVEPLEVETMHVPRFEDMGLFPEGTVEFDSLFQLTQVQRVGLRRLALVEDDGLELATPTSG